MASSDNNKNKKKKIQISSSLEIQSESLHEVVQDRNTGKAKVIDIEEPRKSTETFTLTTNPVTYEAKGIEEPKVKEGEEVKIHPATVGFDTSQL